MKVGRVCRHCGEPFETLLAYVKRGGGLYCSSRCANRTNAKKTRTGSTTPCEVCGAPVYANRWKRKMGWGRFCSYHCRAAASKSAVTVACEQCGEPFQVIPAVLAKGHGRFCSRRCWWDSLRGPSPTYPPEFNDALKSTIRERDGYTCQKCGSPGRDVHHIDRDKTNNHPSNLVTLCKSCHGKAHGGRYALGFVRY